MCAQKNQLPAPSQLGLYVSLAGLILWLVGSLIITGAKLPWLAVLFSLVPYLLMVPRKFMFSRRALHVVASFSLLLFGWTLSGNNPSQSLGYWTMYWLTFGLGLIALIGLLNPKFGHYQIPVFLFIASLLGLGIGLLSGNMGSAGFMMRWLQETIGMDYKEAILVTSLFRKSVHFCFFGLMALLAAFQMKAWRESRAEIVRFGLLWAMGFALFDELRQLSASNRTGSAWDFLLDMAGAIVFLFLARNHLLSPRRIVQKTKG